MILFPFDRELVWLSRLILPEEIADSLVRL